MVSRGFPVKDYGVAFTFVAKSTDFAAVLMGGLLTYRLIAPDTPLSLLPSRYLLVMLLSATLMLAVFSWNGVYDSWRGRRPVKLLQVIGMSWMFTVVTVGVFLFATGQLHEYSPNALAGWALSSFGIMILARALAFGLLRIARAQGWNHKRVVIVGTGDLAGSLPERLRGHPWTGFEVAAFFDDAPTADATSIGDMAIESDLSALPAFVADHQIAEVWIALPFKAEDRLKEVLRLLEHSAVNVRLIPDFFGYRLINHAITNVAGLPMIDLSSSPMQGINLALKAIEDYLLATLAFVLALPLMAVIALAVKLTSPGPVFYRQERVGWNGEPFQMLKFRSMRQDAESSELSWGRARSKPITRVGAFLRRTSLDELPQLINVLRGEMSLVGPRPERTVFVDRFKHEIPGYMQKHLVKAGITGWAQVNGLRGDTDLHQRIEYDIYYIDNWSIGLDLKIMLLTLIKGFFGRNAY